MHLTTRNVNTAFQTLIEGIEDQSIPTIKTPSRNGPVIQIEGPITVTYTHPRERVLFNQVRDCNPFFHLYESLWMLAGRNDVAPLDYYMGGKYSQFSDDGHTANGAYGYRWRHAWTGSETVQADGEVDQLPLIIDHLKRKPESRRAVLHMSTVVEDLLKMDTTKDQCCNISVMFSIRHTPGNITVNARDSHFLDMTITNRSNDIIWGMLGANYVHFGFLQEYVACALGVQVGHYHHFSNNAHIYTETNSGWHPAEWLREYRTRNMHSPRQLSYGNGLNDASGNVGTSQLLFAGDETVELFDQECARFVDVNYGNDQPTHNKPITRWNIQFLERTAQPMMHAFHMYKQRDFEAALHWCSKIAGADWQVAATEWIQRRYNRIKAKLASTIPDPTFDELSGQ